MFDVRFVPLSQWPGKPTPPRQRRQAQFRATYDQTIRLLETEVVRHLSARQITIQAWFRPDQIRQDGWPYSKQNPSDAGVVLSFQRPKNQHAFQPIYEPFSFPCDSFNTYDDNLRAIALALQALRAVDRYGVTRNAEQYTGWRQIEAPAANQEPADAAVVLERLSGLHAADIYRSRDTFEAARKVHQLSSTESRQGSAGAAPWVIPPGNITSNLLSILMMRNYQF